MTTTIGGIPVPESDDGNNWSQHLADVATAVSATYVTVNEGPNPITKYDAVADADGAATDNRTAILSAISDVSAIGGGEVSFVSADGGRFGFTGEIEFPAGVSPVGQAGGQNINRSHLVAQDATAKLKFVGRGGVARNLSLDGAGVSPTMLMLDATCVSRQFERIHVEDCASGDAAVRIEESQNCVFVLLDVVNCGGDGIRLDKGAGGHTFISPHTSRCGGWALNFTDSTLAGPYGDTGPSDNEFYNPIFERLDDATVDGVVRHYAGKNNVMYGPVLSGSGAAATRYLVDMGLDAGVSASSLVLVNPQLSGEGTVTHVHGARVVSGTQLAVMGHVNATALVSVLELTAGTVNWLATYNAGSVTAFKSGAGSEANIVRARTRAANEVTRAASTDPVLLGLVDGDTSARVTLRADGQMQYGPGNASADVTFGRLAAGVMGTGASYCLRTGRAATGARPSASTMGEGSQFFDTTLNKPIWSDGTDWRDAAGTVV